jgi:hypothetical protein
MLPFSANQYAEESSGLALSPTAIENLQSRLFSPFTLKTCDWTVRFAVKGLSLRSDKRSNCAPLTARPARRLAGL